MLRPYMSARLYGDDQCQLCTCSKKLRDSLPNSAGAAVESFGTPSTRAKLRDAF